MKNIFKYFLLLIAVGTTVSCSDDFLESEVSQFISADRMVEMREQNPEIFNGTVRGMYTTMFQTGTGGSTGHDDFGQKGFDIYSDMLCGDMVLGGYNYGWYKNVATMASTVDFTDGDNYRAWRYYYRMIRAANAIIDGLGGNDVVLEDQNQKWQMGQAKTMRAYSYFYLAHFYAEDFDMTKEILPIYTSQEDVNQPLSTAADVWSLIKNDLEAASELMVGYARGSNLHEVNEDVTNTFLAYTYLTMGEYKAAIAAADKVIAKGYAIIPQDQVGWNGENYRNAYSYVDGDGADWIWGMDLTLDQGLDLISWWGQVDLTTYSYAWAGDPKTMDEGLYASIPADDARKGQFLNLGGYYPIIKWHYENWLTPEGQINAGAQREITADYVYMRIEELYLLKAEAQAFDNQDGAAQTTLTALLSERVADPSYVTALTGQALKDEIYKQWRIEMWGEGKSYLAMMRNGATITRQGHIDFNISIDYNDDRLTFEIPYQEIQDNPNISK